MFKQNKPAGQPRTLRSIAEGENDPASFPPPSRLPENEAVYIPNADSAALSRGATPRPNIDPQPFKKGG